jgi:hypothetical protein
MMSGVSLWAKDAQKNKLKQHLKTTCCREYHQSAKSIAAAEFKEIAEAKLRGCGENLKGVPLTGLTELRAALKQFPCYYLGQIIHICVFEELNKEATRWKVLNSLMANADLRQMLPKLADFPQVLMVDTNVYQEMVQEMLLPSAVNLGKAQVQKRFHGQAKGDVSVRNSLYKKEFDKTSDEYKEKSPKEFDIRFIRIGTGPPMHQPNPTNPDLEDPYAIWANNFLPSYNVTRGRSLILGKGSLSQAFPFSILAPTTMHAPIGLDKVTYDCAFFLSCICLPVSKPNLACFGNCRTMERLWIRVYCHPQFPQPITRLT